MLLLLPCHICMALLCGRQSRWPLHHHIIVCHTHHLSLANTIFFNIFLNFSHHNNLCSFFLFTLAKQSKQLGAYNVARYAFDKLQARHVFLFFLFVELWNEFIDLELGCYCVICCCGMLLLGSIFKILWFLSRDVRCLLFYRLFMFLHLCKKQLNLAVSPSAPNLTMTGM